MDNTPISFDRDFSINGKWWVPNGQIELYGELIYKQGEEITLKLSNAFNGEDDLKYPSLQKHDTILGIDSKGNYYTLLNATGFTHGRSIYFQTTLTIEYVLKSHWQIHFDFQKHKIRAANFTTNFFMAFLHGKYNSFEGPSLQHQVLQMSLKETPDMDILQMGPLKLSFLFDYGYHTTNPLYNFHFNQDIHLKADFGDNVKVKEVAIELNFIKDFFSLFSYYQISFRTAYLDIADENSDIQRCKFNLLFIERATRLGQLINIWDVLLPFTGREDEIKLALTNWFNNREFVVNGLSLYFDVSYNKVKQPINAFLNLVFALETFHKTYHYSSRKTLRTRLEQLIQKNQGILTPYFPDPEKFCQRVVSQRNYLAHEHGSPNSVISSDDYPYYIHMLKLLFEISFLKIMDISPDSLEFFAKKNRSYEYYKNNIPRDIAI